MKQSMVWVAIPAFGIAWFSAGCDAPAGMPCGLDAGIVEADAAATAQSDAYVREADADPGVLPDAFLTRADAGGAPMRDAGPGDAGPPPRCIGSYAEGVAIFAEESSLSLRAHADPEETTVVTAWPWRVSLDSVRPVAVDVEWRTEGDGTLFRTEALADPRERRLLLAARGDVFDRGGHEEPLLTVQACVRNACPPHAADGSPCSCREEVCSAVILAGAIPVLGGRWEFSGDGFDTGTMPLLQDGRELTGLPFPFPLRIEGVGVSGGDLGEYVDGAIGADRRSLSGLRTNEDGDVIGTWSARRVD